MATDPKTDLIELNRKSIHHPGEEDLKVTLFSCWQKAVKHLLDHVVTPPESFAWQRLITHDFRLLDEHENRFRYTYAKQAWDTCGISCQDLFDQYADAINAAALEATALGWWVTQGQVTVALGINGVLVLIESRVLATAFLPGHGDPQSVTESRQSKINTGPSGLSRERGMRCGGNRNKQQTREHHEKQLRSKGWTDEQRIFHLVFRPAVQFIRRQHHVSRDFRGRRIGVDYALLKSVLPRLSQLKLESWRELRTRIQGGKT